MRCASSSLGGDYPLRTRTAPLVSPRRRGSSLGSRRRGSTRVEMRYRRIVFPDYKSERDRRAPGLLLFNVCSFSLSYNPSPVPCCASLFDSVDLARVGGVADRTAAPVMARHRGEGSQGGRSVTFVTFSGVARWFTRLSARRCGEFPVALLRRRQRGLPQRLERLVGVEHVRANRQQTELQSH